MEKRKIAFQTFGCKLNFAETSTLSRMFSPEEFEQVTHKEEADIYVIHSCSVTANAEKKTRAAIRHAKKLNPKSSVAVIGCYAQLRPHELMEMPEVDIVMGNREKYRLPGIYLNNDFKNLIDVDDSNIMKDMSYKSAYSSGDRTRSFLKIQDGCDYFCTYCTIPYARGKSRSSNIEEIINTASRIGKSGVKEIILTGVNIGDFGKNHGEKFFELMKELEKVEGIERYRISSIEPDLLNKDIIDFVAKSSKFLPHFHIPLQSGNNDMLKRMNRKYDREIFSRHVNYIKQVMPDACIAVDLIVGFPGETEELFRDSASFIKSLPVSYLHVFTYSSRPNTKAENMKEKVPGNIKKERSIEMHDISTRMRKVFLESQKGKTGHVLWESNLHGKYMQGWTGNYIKVKKPYDKHKVNTIETVKLEKLNNESFILE
ncbi:MAG: tRNA (N(6)-L-threonylcarbamoyladenosine(37)-C(2))-methylthiotransferase MtaB [Bacteroidales bacterium]|nr:tRNA (N(6)-L-threonylcarbamoyladenosine(37)-C(2))-methylthiotransferase MtaB [Bacteroidales bacterium]